jgi:hypothetical protein
MVWKSPGTVAFAVKNNWAFAWFCGNRLDDKTNLYGSAAWGTNVKKACKNADGVDVCVNEEELRKTNGYRAERKGFEAENLLTLDYEMAKQIQILLVALPQDDLTKFPGRESRGMDGKYFNCQENSGPKTAGKSISEDWYTAGSVKYDEDDAAGKTVFVSGATDADKLNAKKFMRMVWKTAKRVGYGFHNDNVVAWYCDIASTNLETKTEANDNVGKSCVSAEGINGCFAKRVVDATNKKRAIHRVAAIPVLDKDTFLGAAPMDKTGIEANGKLIRTGWADAKLAEPLTLKTVVGNSHQSCANAYVRPSAACAPDTDLFKLVVA